MLISRSRRSAYSARSCFSAPCAAQRFQARRAAFRSPGARRIRSSCRWCGSAGTSNFGNGSFTFSSLTWQRWAMSQVRSSASSTSPNSVHHLVARLEVELGLRRSACGSDRDMVLPVWMHSRISCARASSCAGNANRWWRPAECRVSAASRMHCGSTTSSCSRP